MIESCQERQDFKKKKNSRDLDVITIEQCKSINFWLLENKTKKVAISKNFTKSTLVETTATSYKMHEYMQVHFVQTW